MSPPRAAQSSECELTKQCFSFNCKMLFCCLAKWTINVAVIEVTIGFLPIVWAFLFVYKAETYHNWLSLHRYVKAKLLFYRNFSE